MYVKETVLLAVLSFVCVLTSVAHASGPTPIFSDTFETGLTWTRSGYTSWYTGTPKNGTHSVRLRMTGKITKNISLAGASNVTVHFKFGAYSLDSSEEYAVAEYYNGTAWTELARINNFDANENNKLNVYSVALPTSQNGNAAFAVRFRIQGSSFDDYANVDDVVVEVGDATTPTLATIAGCPLFTVNDEWNRDVSSLAVDRTWTSYFNSNWGSSYVNVVFGTHKGDPAGMPYNIVPASQPLLPITWDWPSDWGPIQTDQGPYPFPGKNDVWIQAGDPYCASGSDCHILVAQAGTCKLYEGYGCRYNDVTGGYTCVNGAIFDLTKTSYGQRPDGWTSSDAAGLPVIPGLIRYAEVAQGEIKHALRFQVAYASWNYIKPASHSAQPGGAPSNGPPMGLRVRLKENFDISGYSTQNQVILRALKKYGAILADSNYPNPEYIFQADVDPGWGDDDLYGLWNVPNSAFEVVQTYQ